jgi:hypothetical protein
VAAGDELEEQVRGVLFEGQVADLIGDDQPVAALFGELGGKPTALVGVLETSDPVGGGGEQDPLSVWQAATPRAIATWVFPVPGGPSRTMLRASVR